MPVVTIPSSSSSFTVSSFPASVFSSSSFFSSSLSSLPSSSKLEELLIQHESKHKIKGGIKSLYSSDILDQNIKKIAQILLKNETRNICILLGSPNCPLHWPPTDNDNLSGALALTNCLLLLNKKVYILCDTVNDSQLKPIIANNKIWSSKRNLSILESNLSCVSFPSALEWTDECENQLKSIFDDVQFIINVGRLGVDSEGKSRTWDARDVSHVQPPFEKLFAWAHKSKMNFGSNEVHTAVIAELGNELGSGMLKNQVEKYVQAGKEIACHIQADFAILSTVVNWGAFALCAYLGNCVVRINQMKKAEMLKNRENGNVQEEDCKELCTLTAEDFCMNKQVFQRLLKLLDEEYCRCGVTGSRGEVIDGFDLSENWRVLDLISNECRSIFEAKETFQNKNELDQR